MSAELDFMSIDGCKREVRRLERLNAELLKALKLCERVMDNSRRAIPEISIIRAVIAKEEGREGPRCDCGGSPHGKGCSLVLDGIEPYVHTPETSSQTREDNH